MSVYLECSECQTLFSLDLERKSDDGLKIQCPGCMYWKTLNEKERTANGK